MGQDSSKAVLKQKDFLVQKVRRNVYVVLESWCLVKISSFPFIGQMVDVVCNYIESN